MSQTVNENYSTCFPSNGCPLVQYVCVCWDRHRKTAQCCMVLKCIVGLLTICSPSSARSTAFPRSAFTHSLLVDVTIVASKCQPSFCSCDRKQSATDWADCPHCFEQVAKWDVAPFRLCVRLSTHPTGCWSSGGIVQGRRRESKTHWLCKKNQHLTSFP